MKGIELRACAVMLRKIEFNYPMEFDFTGLLEIRFITFWEKFKL